MFCGNHLNLGNCCCVLSFWHRGPIRGKKCIQINVPSKPSNESWERSHLCWPHDGIYKFRWLTQRPSSHERDSCLEWTEPRDPTWKAKTYYLCATKVQQAIGMSGRYVNNSAEHVNMIRESLLYDWPKICETMDNISCSPKFPRF